MHLFAQSGYPKFKRLTTYEGLSQGHVSAIVKRSNGFNYKIDLPGMSISHELIFKAQIASFHSQ